MITLHVIPRSEALMHRLNLARCHIEEEILRSAQDDVESQDGVGSRDGVGIYVK